MGASVCDNKQEQGIEACLRYFGVRSANLPAGRQAKYPNTDTEHVMFDSLRGHSDILHIAAVVKLSRNIQSAKRDNMFRDPVCLRAFFVKLLGRWRNWYTRMVQGHVPAMVCEFKSRSAHNTQ